MPRKNVEDELRSVDHPPLNDFFDVALLRRAEIVVEQYDVGIDRRGRARNLFQLSSADQRRRIGTVAPLQDFADDFRPGALRESSQFSQGFFGIELWNGGLTLGLRAIGGRIPASFLLILFRAFRRQRGRGGRGKVRRIAGRRSLPSHTFSSASARTDIEANQERPLAFRFGRHRDGPKRHTSGATRGAAGLLAVRTWQ